MNANHRRFPAIISYSDLFSQLFSQLFLGFPGSPLEERVLVPEVLFESNRGPRQTLPQIIVECASMVHSKGTLDGNDGRVP